MSQSVRLVLFVMEEGEEGKVASIGAESDPA